MPAGDHRDWDEIRRFAESLVAEIPVAAALGTEPRAPLDSISVP
jgi:hypothetical protein